MANGFASAPVTLLGSAGNAGANAIYLTKITLLRSATVAAVLINTGGAGSGNFRVLIYDGAHSALLASSATVTSLVAQYNRVPLSAPVTLAAGTYYVGFVEDAGYSVSIDSSQTNSSWFVSSGMSTASPPNPLATGVVQNNGLFVALEFDSTGAATRGFAPDYSTGVTLSGGLGNATATTTTAASMGARSVVAASGKVYAEVLVGGTMSGTGGTQIGVVSALFPLNLPPSLANAHSALMNSTGGITINNLGSGSGPAFAAGDVVNIAYDAAAGTIWWNKNSSTGTWGSGGDPVAGTGGKAFGNAGWPILLCAFSNANTTFTLRDTAGSFAYPVPSGFSPWASGATVELVTQVAVEHWLATNPNAQITQVALEHWASTTSTGLQAVVTQVVLEHWASVANVSTVRNGPFVTMIG
jgi:hypothetical protein